MPLVIPACAPEKKEKREKKKTRAGRLTAAAILWMTPLYLGIHQSGIMRAAWLETRDFDGIKYVVNRELNAKGHD